MSGFEDMMKKVINKRRLRDDELSKELTVIYRDAFVKSYYELEDMLFRQEEGENISKYLLTAKVEYTRQLYNEIEKAMDKYMDLETEDYINASMTFYDSILDDFKRDELFKAMKDKAQITNKRILDIMHKGEIYKDNAGLSDRLWFAADASGNKLQDAIMSCIAQGKSAADMAKAIEKFGKGGHKYWSRDDIEWHLGKDYANRHSGGLDYAALRLARTTLTHMHQLQVVRSNEYNPYVNKVKWHSVHAAGRTCDLCIERDGTVYARTKAPFDHPNGMCYLEPVFADANGKVLTPEEVAADIGKWIKGEKNSGLMDKIPEYKKLPVPKVKAKITPKPEKPKETKPKMDSKLKEQLIAYNNYFASKVSKSDHKQYMQGAANILGSHFPRPIQDAYLTIFKGILQLTQNNTGAYWNAGQRLVQFNIDTVLAQAKKYNRGAYDVWFHETGHAMDYLLAQQVAMREGKGGKVKVLSAKKAFINALKKDYANQQTMIRRKYLKEKGYNIEGYTESQLKNMIPDSELSKLYNYYLANKHKTAGIQDVVEGISNCKIRVQWGHGKEYWNRRNRDEEYASEAWANILGSYSDPETYEYMKEYFPEAMAMQEKIIEECFKKLGGN